MRNIEFMIGRKEEKLESVRSILDRAESEGRTLTAEEESRYKVGMKEVKQLAEEIETETASQAVELGGGNSGPIYGAAMADGGISRASGKPGREYRSLFGEVATSGPWRDKGEFLDVVFSGRHDPRLEARQFQGGEDTLGGYAMPVELTSWLLDRSLENEIVRPRATVYPMQWRTRRIPAWAATRRTEDYEDQPWSLFGGFRPVWLDELEESDNQEATLRTIDLVARKLGIFAAASNEIIADGLDFEFQVTNAMLRAVSFTLDYYFLRGEGAGEGQPTGVLNCGELITVDRTGAGEIVYADIVNMYSRLHPAACNRAVWVCSYEAIPQLLQMVDAANHLIWNPPVRAGVPGHLFGLPLLRTEKLPGLGNTGDILLADFQHYAIGIRKEMSLEKSNVPGWQQDVMNYRVLARVDGQGTWEQAILPAEGEDSLSWCVTLGEGYGS